MNNKKETDNKLIVNKKLELLVNNEVIYKKFLGYITNRLGIKLLCVLMSFLLFMYVRYQKEYTKDYITKVEIRNIPSKSLIVNNIPDTITITLKGFKDNIYELPTEFSAYIDLTNAKVGSNIYDIYLDGNIDYSKMNITVNPNKIPIILDELSYKTVPIVVPAISNTSLGLKVDDIIINPSNATIYGPKSLLSTVEEIKTHNLDLTNVCLDYSTTSKLNLPKNICYKLVFSS